ncbi:MULTISPECIES: alpha/beta hydrolase [unclassified Pseudomonas]|uniref:alpha/beta hydrolase n=1 Tax=unclassified Pseudomonas TaxID=196821 RepID=UPI0017832631|nr:MULTISPECIES: alpha/beta hydrolase [unclassified Pseudomonas]MBD8730772.1 alpha/beta hydrolase [Pseudomonas sp. CFBP 13710]MBD8828310.1 alpha/beta hydrolase [Pseudomonas sp. CFBP 13602]
MDTDRLLDPSYEFFLTEPSRQWTRETLASIRDDIHNDYRSADTAHGQQQWTESDADCPPVRLRIHRPRSETTQNLPLPAILYIHGGGFVLGCPEMADGYLADLAADLQVVVVAVDYRLAPEHPFPAPLEDCYRALTWIYLNSLSQGIDEHKVVIMGHSAGGGLAAALALLARDREQRKAAGLVMIYPMLDHRTGSASSLMNNPATGRLSWSRAANHFCWQCMQGEYDANDERAYLLSPSLAPHLEGLPPSFIGVGALDLFLEEDVEFGLKLSRSGVPVEMHVYPGVPHMFDQYPGAVTEQSNSDVRRALGKMVHVAVAN